MLQICTGGGGPSGCGGRGRPCRPSSCLGVSAGKIQRNSFIVINNFPSSAELCVPSFTLSGVVFRGARDRGSVVGEGLSCCCGGGRRNKTSCSRCGILVDGVSGVFLEGGNRVDNIERTGLIGEGEIRRGRLLS